MVIFSAKKLGTFGTVGAPPGYTIVFSNVTLTLGSYLIGVTGNPTLTLPNAQSATSGTRFVIFDLNGTAGNTGTQILIKTFDSGETINGQAGVILNTAFGSADIMGLGSSGWKAKVSGRGVTGTQGKTGLSGYTGLYGETGIMGTPGI